MSPDEMLHLPDQGMGLELIDGQLRETSATFLSQHIAGLVMARLREYAERRNLGWVFGAGLSFRCFPSDTQKVSRALVSFIPYARLAPSEVQARRQGHCTVVPDLVVEVVSPNDLAYEVNEKRIEWLEAGAKLVWVIDPVQETIHAYRADGTVHLFGRSDALTAEPVLPQFTVSVAELFQLPVETPA